MTSPAYHKSGYQFVQNWTGHNGQRGTGEAVPPHTAVYLKVFSTLTGFSSNPWTYESSCDSLIAHNNDQVNVIIDDTDMVYAAGAHSWVVLKQAALGGEASVCFDFGSSVAWYQPLIYVSYGAGFGASNGGADGTTTARPTATDERQMITGAWQNDSGSHSHTAFNFMMSNDGQVTRIFQVGPISNDVGMMFCIEKARSPIPEWTSPVIARAQKSLGASASILSLFSGTTGYKFHEGGDHGVLVAYHAPYYTIPGDGANARDAQQSRMHPILFASVSTNLVGIWGGIYDAYFAPDVPMGTLARDDDNLAQWIVIDQLWVPWQGEGLLTACG